jgi:phage-related minor tail protein
MGEQVKEAADMAKNTVQKSQKDTERFAQRATKIERIVKKVSHTAKILTQEKDDYLKEVMALVAEARRAGWRVELTQEADGKVISSVDLSDNPAGFLSLQTHASVRIYPLRAALIF